MSDNVGQKYFVSVPRTAGTILLLQLFLCYAVVSVGFMSGIPLGWWAFPVSFLCACLVPAFLGSCGAAYRRACVAVVICWAAALPGAAVMVDYSYDGNGYHQEIVAALCDGWLMGSDEVAGLSLSIWARHYAKALEMMQAAVVSCTGNLESGKAVNYILGASAGFIVYAFLRECFPDMSRRKVRVCVMVAVCNPVFLSQMLTFYIDYSKYFYTLLSLVILFEIAWRPRSAISYVLLAVVACMAVATKFNAFFEEGLVFVAGMIWFACARRMDVVWRIALCGLCAVATGVFLLGYHPYITNWIGSGHPLYPLMGDGCVDIMSYNTPDVFLEHGRIWNFFRSLFSITVPNVDSRAGGFGPFMPVMLAVSLWAVWKMRRLADGAVLYISAWILASCFIFGQSWWARYISQLWLVVAAGTVMLLSAFRAPCWVCRLQVGLVAVTAALCLGSGIARDVKAACFRHVVISEIKGREVRVMSLKESYRRQLEERGIRAVEAAPGDTAGVRVPYYGVVSSQHYPVLLLDSVTRVAIIKRLERLPFDYSRRFDPDYVGE